MNYQMVAQVLGAAPGEMVELAHSFLVEVGVALLMLVAGLILGGYRSRKEWKHAQFRDRLNFSLNIVTSDTLRIRTILEDVVSNVILSPYARALLKKAAAQTTPENEFLRFPTERDSWMVYNEITNAISETCGPHLLAAAARGTDFQEKQFMIDLTYERNKDIRIQKLRVLIVEKSVLQQIADADKAGTPISVEVEAHKPRLRTLLRIHTESVDFDWPEHQIVSLPCP